MDVILNRVLSARKQALSSNPDRPFVCATWAQSADGMIAAAPGVRTVISGNESMVMTHMLRAVHDAILVGVGTVLADDPRLSCRLNERDTTIVNAALERYSVPLPGNGDASPTAVVLDPRIRTPKEAKFLRQPHCQDLKRRPFIFFVQNSEKGTSEQRNPMASLVRFKGISSATADFPRELHKGDAAPIILCLKSVLEGLKSENVSSVMVEGGATVLSSFLKSGLCDLVIITIAPTLLGAGLSIAAKSGHEPFSAMRLSDPKWVQCGEDIVLVGTPK